jgi:urease accessory protein
MLRLDRILGHATDEEMARRLHILGHADRVEHIVLGGDDVQRHRLHVRTDRGTECAIMVPRAERLSDGAVLLLESARAIVVRLEQARFLALAPRDAAAAIELGYFAGNMHWPVKFAGAVLRIALQGPERAYLDRLAPLLGDGRIQRVDDAG